MPVASGSGTVPETPSPRSTTQAVTPAPQTLENTTNVAVTAPFTQIASIPNTLSASPTPEPSSAPSVPRPPQITPIITSPALQSGSSNKKGPTRESPHDSSVTESSTESSGSQEAPDPPTKKAKGRFPYR